MNPDPKWIVVNCTAFDTVTRMRVEVPHALVGRRHVDIPAKSDPRYRDLELRCRWTGSPAMERWAVQKRYPEFFARPLVTL